MNNTNPLHVVLGASGGSGLAITKELIKRGENVRGVNTSGVAPAGINAEYIACDATNQERLIKACEGATYIYHALNVSYEHWLDVFPTFTNNVIAAAKANNAKVIYVDNLYAYGPTSDLISENTPEQAIDAKGQLRSKLTKQLLNSGIEIVVTRSSDFFGPNTQSFLADRVFNKAIDNKPAQDVGDSDKIHTYTYVGDGARAIVMLALDPQAYGQTWHIPGYKMSTSDIIKEVYNIAGSDFKIKKMNKLGLTLLSPFVPIFKELLPLYYQRDRDFIINSEKFMATYPNFKLTPLREALTETMEWFRFNKLK